MPIRIAPPRKSLLILRVLLVLGMVLGSVQPGQVIAYAAARTEGAVRGGEAGPGDTIDRPAPIGEAGRRLALSVSGPVEVTPGEEIALTVEVWNIGTQPLEGGRLQLNEGPKAGLVGGAVPLPKLAVNERTTVTLAARVIGGPGQVLEAHIEVVGGDLDMEAKALYQAMVRQTEPEIWRPVAGAAVWQSAVGHLEVVLPADRDKRIALIAVRGLYGRAERREARHLYAFEITARDAQERLIEQFDRPVILRWRYGEALQERPPLIPPHFVWWNELKQQWEDVPTKVDEKQGVIEAEVWHFSVYGVTGRVIEPKPDEFSGLNSDLYTGSLSYRFPMPLVQRPAGFGPGLALNYNSRRRDQQQNFGSNGSLVGWGWRLDGLDTIEWVGGEEYKLSLGEATYTVKRTAAFVWYAQEAPELKITRANSNQDARWHVYTPDGTRYEFIATNTLRRCNRTTTPETLEELAKTFVLTSVTGPADAFDFDYSMNITYTTATRQVNVYCNGQNHNLNYIYQTWPTQITYNGLGNGYNARVDFFYTSRTDYPKECDSLNCNGITNDHIYYYTQMLDKIEVWVQDNFVWTKARTYDFTSSVQDGRLVLDSVRVIGKGDAASLPAVTFEYTNESTCRLDTSCRLRLIRNGQGAEVYLNYEYGGSVYQNGQLEWSMYRVTWLDPQNGFGGTRPRSIWYSSSWDARAGGHNLTIVTYWGAGNGSDGDERRTQHDFCHPLTTAYCPNPIPNDTGHYGQEFQTVVRNPADQNRIAYRTWRTFARPPLPTGVDQAFEHVRFVLKERREYVYTATGNEVLAFRQRLDYELGHQGGWQHGNVTHIRDYNGSNQLIRTRERKYYPGTNVRNRVAEEWLWEGDVGGVCRGYTRYFYDNAPAVTTPPGKGLLTEVQAAKTSCNSGDGDFITLQKMDYEPTWDNLSWQEDGLGQRTNFTYDSHFHTYLIHTTNPLSHTVSQTYDYVLGLPLEVTDANNVTTIMTYDALGRKRTVNRPGGHPSVDEAWEYGDYGGSSAPQWVTHKVYDGVTTPANPGDGYLVTRQYLDGFGRLLQTQREAEAGNGHAIAVTVAYNAHNQLWRSSAPYALAQSVGARYVSVSDWGTIPHTRYDYDNYGRVITTTLPDGSVTTTSYDGLKTVTVDANDHKVEQEVDAFGRLAYVRQYMGKAEPYTLYSTTTYQYDVQDRLDKVIGPDNTVIDPGYNLLGWKTAMADPNMGTWSYAYDAAGNLVRQTDARNRTVCFYYDGLNRLTGKHYRTDPNCPTSNPTLNVSYSYDSTANGNKGIGRRTGMSDASGSTSWVYDERGRVTEERKVINGTGGGTFTTRWSYDAMDRVQTMTYPGGEVVNYTYNPQGLVEQIYRSSPTPIYYYVGGTTYNALGQVTERRLGSTTGVLRQLYTYSAAENFRLTALQSGTGPNYNNRQNISYTYDDVGNVLTITDAAAVGGSQTQTFTYDFLDRLLSAGVSGGSGGLYSENYEYSGNGGKIGNLTKKGTTNYTYGTQSAGCPDGALTKPHAVVTAGTNTYCYDRNGNMVRRTVGGTAYTLTYDAENRLTQVKKNGSVIATFVYDGDGKRVKATVNGTTTVYIGDYYELTGSTGRKYYYANGQRVAMRVGGTPYYLLTDHLGSTAITANSSGSRVAELRYKAWGEPRYTDGTTPTTYRFTGQRLDDATGLYYYGARYYDPALGRFISPDPLPPVPGGCPPAGGRGVPEPGNPQALNRYAYVYNNPLRYTDPTGHFSEDEICTYWGYCSEEEARAALGEELFNMLWNTAITWGDLLFIGDEQGVTTVAMFVLMGYEEGGTYRYRAGLWGVKGEGGGRPLDWATAKGASRLAAYNAAQNVWEGMNRREAEAWVGTVPEVEGARSLRLAQGVYEYQFATYVDLNGWWWVAAGVTVAAWPPAAAGKLIAQIIRGAALLVDAAGLAGDVIGLDFGPVDATYPAVYYDPLRIGRAPYQIHIGPPRGGDFNE